MKLFVTRKSSSSVNSSDTETLDHYFRISNIPAIKQYFDLYPEKVNCKEQRVINNSAWLDSFVSSYHVRQHRNHKILIRNRGSS